MTTVVQPIGELMLALVRELQALLKPDDRLLDKDELAVWLGVPVTWVRDAISRRAIPITWIGRHARFSAADRAAIVAAGHEAPTNPIRIAA